MFYDGWSFKKKVVAIVFLFAIIFNVALRVWGDQLNALGGLEQFLLITLGIYLLPSIILAVLVRQQLDWKGVVGALCFTGGLDLLAPPFMVDFNGQITQAFMSKGALDVIIAGVWQSFGISGQTLWIFVYPITFFILVGLASWILTRKQIIDILD